MATCPQTGKELGSKLLFNESKLSFGHFNAYLICIFRG